VLLPLRYYRKKLQNLSHLNSSLHVCDCHGVGFAGSSFEVKIETDSNDAVKIKTEADSNDITEHAHHGGTSTGMFGLFMIYPPHEFIHC